MKKILAALCWVFLFCACGVQKRTAAENELILAVRFDTEDEVYRGVIEYYLGEEFMGGQSGSHADNTPLDRGEVLCFVLTKDEEFPEGRAPKAFRFQLMLADSPEMGSIEDDMARKGLTEVPETEPFDASFGTVYSYTVTGSFADGFTLTQDAE